MLPLLEVKNLTKIFQIHPHHAGSHFTALNNLCFTLQPGQTLGILGENGSGKSTLAKLLAGLIAPTEGEIYLQGERLYHNSPLQSHSAIRLVGQNPDSRFNPRYRIKDILIEPLRLNTQLSLDEAERRVIAMLKQVGLPAELRHQYPSHLAAGQKQRVAFAQALMLQPRLLITDDLCAVLDLTIEAQIINLMLKLQQESQLSYIYISQDIQLIRHISDTIIVMHEGSIIEQGATEHIFQHPEHNITKKLLYDYFGNLSD